MKTKQNDLELQFSRLIQDAFRVSNDLGQEVADELSRVPISALTTDEAYSVLSKTIERVQRAAILRNDAAVSNSLNGPVARIVAKIMECQRSIRKDAPTESSHIVELVTYNDIAPRAVLPAPTFHGEQVPVIEGYVKTSDIKLWNKNERLEIHLNQFRKRHGRGPTDEELIKIMLGELNLPGTPSGSQADEFDIKALARSVATNGVRVRPILDLDGTLLDGNRRVTACHYILNSPDFTSEEKRAIEYIKVWRLTEHAEEKHREVVVVSLNFEDDYKKKWPTYIKARKVNEAYELRLRLEPGATYKRTSEIYKEIARMFAIERATVERYIRMVQWADDFEQHQVAERGHEEFEVKHRATKEFEYFDELSKGKSAGTVGYTLNANPEFKHLVYDLLFQDKFKNWTQLRDLKHVISSDEALALLQRAKEEDDPEFAAEYVESAIAIARNIKAQTREQGANTKIRYFVKFMSELPVGSLTSDKVVDPENLFKLLAVMRLAEAQAKTAYGDILEPNVENAAKDLR